jgi:RNA polymerase sigma-70 factor, ECF subfamily
MPVETLIPRPTAAREQPRRSLGLQETDSELSGPRREERELIERVRKGDDSAYELIVQTHAKRLYGLAYSMLGSPSDADDVVQETFLGAYKQLPSFEGRSSLKTWLTRICVLQVSKLYRSRRVRRAASLDAGDDSGGAGDSGPSVGSHAEHSDRRADVQAMLATLSPEHRQVLVLRELQGLSYKEIADALGIPQGTVESRLFRARQELKERFKDYLLYYPTWE